MITLNDPSTMFSLALLLAVNSFAATPHGYMATNATALTSVNPTTGEQTNLIPSNFGISTLVFTSGGQVAYGGSLGSPITEIDVSTGRFIRAFNDTGVQSLLLSSDNSTVFAYNFDTSLTVFNAATGATLKSYAANTPNAFGMSETLSADGNTVWLLASYNQNIEYNPVFITLTAVDAHNLNVLGEFFVKGISGAQFAIAPDNKSVYLAGVQSLVQIDIKSHSVLNTFPLPASALTLTGNTLLVASGESVLAFSTSTQQILNQVSLPFAPTLITLSPDQSTLYAYAAVGTSDVPTVQPMNIEGLTLGASFSLPYPTAALVANPTSGSLWSASTQPGLIASFSPKTGERQSLAESTFGTTHVVPVPGGSKVYGFNTYGSTIDVFDGATLKLLSTITVPVDYYNFLTTAYAASPNGAMVYVLDFGIQAINTSTDTIVATLNGSSIDLSTSAMAVSRDSKTLYVANGEACFGDCLIQTYDAATLQPLEFQAGFPQELFTLLVSPDGTELYALGLDSTGANWLYVLDAKTLSTKNSGPAVSDQAVLSNDGKTLYLLALIESSLQVQAVDTTTLLSTRTYPITLPAGATPTGGYLALSPDGLEIYVSPLTGASQTPLLLINIGSGAQTNTKTYLTGPIAF